MNILFIHQNFPGQFLHLAPSLVSLGHNVSTITLNTNLNRSWNGVTVHKYKLLNNNRQQTSSLVTDFESKVIRAESCARAALTLKESGYNPDLIVAHPGWGEALFLQEIWPATILKLYAEYFYNVNNADSNFDPEFKKKDEIDLAKVKLKNANLYLSFDKCHSAICPTKWQASTFPDTIKNKISVIHDGIATDKLLPNRDVNLKLSNGKTLGKSDLIITFVSRSLEPYRGFHSFMRSLPTLFDQLPDLQVLIIGKEGTSYGAKPSGPKSWKQLYVEEVFPNLTKQQQEQVHFCGQIPYETYVSVLRISTVHVYLTYPFVLSWSLLESMSLGCAIVAADTAPVREVIKHEVTGLLFDFFSPVALADACIKLLCDKDLMASVRINARSAAVKNFDLRTVCLPKQQKWVLEDV